MLESLARLIRFTRCPIQRLSVWHDRRRPNIVFYGQTTSCTWPRYNDMQQFTIVPDITTLATAICTWPDCPSQRCVTQNASAESSLS